MTRNPPAPSRRTHLTVAVALATFVATGCGTVVSGEPDASAIGVDARSPVDAPVNADAPLPIDAAPIACDMGDINAFDDMNGHCYMLFTTSERWTTSSLLCTTLPGNAHLVTITDDRESQFVTMLLGSRDVWLGGNDMATPDNWEWVTGEPFNFANWDAGEPNDANEHCIRANGNRGGRWHDTTCDNRIPYICERP